MLSCPPSWRDFLVNCQVHWCHFPLHFYLIYWIISNILLFFKYQIFAFASMWLSFSRFLLHPSASFWSSIKILITFTSEILNFHLSFYSFQYLWTHSLKSNDLVEESCVLWTSLNAFHGYLLISDSILSIPIEEKTNCFNSSNTKANKM